MCKIIIRVCPICHRVKKHGIWCILTNEDKWQINLNAQRIVEDPQVCPQHEFLPTQEDLVDLQNAFL